MNTDTIVANPATPHGAAMQKLVRRLAHGAVDRLGLPTCRRDVYGATAAYAGAVQAQALGETAAFPTAGGYGWSFVPDTTPGSIVARQR